MKRIFSFLLAALLLVSAVPMAQATNDYTAGTKVEYTAANNEAYTITVPAQLAPGGSGTVTLSGTWADNRVVTVTADPTVILKNSIKETDTKTLNVNFDGGISEKGSNTTSQTFTKDISVDGITDALFGTWSGKFNYNVEIKTNLADCSEIGCYDKNNDDHCDYCGVQHGQYYNLLEDGLTHDESGDCESCDSAGYCRDCWCDWDCNWCGAFVNCEPWGSCESFDGDHYCDACGEDVGCGIVGQHERFVPCYDEDGDNVCDCCENSMTCDICGSPTENGVCALSGFDGTGCVQCGGDMGDDDICDSCDWWESACRVCGGQGQVMEGTCDYCGADCYGNGADCSMIDAGCYDKNDDDLCDYCGEEVA